MLQRPIPQYPRYELDYLDTIRIDECSLCGGDGGYWCDPTPYARGGYCQCDRCEGSGELRTNVTGTDEELPEDA